MSSQHAIDNRDRDAATWLTASGALADAVRVAALVSAFLVMGSQPAEGVLRFFLVFAVLLVTRFAHIPRPFDAAFGLLLLFSSWASALHWYVTYQWIDIPIHFALTGATAAVLYIGLTRLDVLTGWAHSRVEHPVARVVVMVTALGGAAALVWEIYEWLVQQYIPSRILVGYDDTIGDVTNGLIGSLVAGVLTARWERWRHEREQPQ